MSPSLHVPSTRASFPEVTIPPSTDVLCTYVQLHMWILFALFYSASCSVLPCFVLFSLGSLPGPSFHQFRSPSLDFPATRRFADGPDPQSLTGQVLVGGKFCFLFSESNSQPFIYLLQEQSVGG